MSYVYDGNSSVCSKYFHYYSDEAEWNIPELSTPESFSPFSRKPHLLANWTKLPGDMDAVRLQPHQKEKNKNTLQLNGIHQTFN